MPSLDERFRALTEIRPPEDWSDLEELEPRPPERVPRLRRLAVAALALAVAAAGFAIAIRAFGSKSPRRQVEGGVAQPRVTFSMFQSSSWQLYGEAVDGSGLEPLTHMDANVLTGTSWSPDGSMVAFGVQRDGHTETYVMNADGTGLHSLIDGPGWNWLPSWSPDGALIAFASARDGNSEIYVADADGTDERRLTHDPAEDLDPVWSPDGSQIAFQSNRGANNDIYVMNADGGGVRNLTNDPAFDGHPTWSPDGSRIAFASDRAGRAST